MGMYGDGGIKICSEFGIHDFLTDFFGDTAFDGTHFKEDFVTLSRGLRLYDTGFLI